MPSYQMLPGHGFEERGFAKDLDLFSNVISQENKIASCVRKVAR